MQLKSQTLTLITLLAVAATPLPLKFSALPALAQTQNVKIAQSEAALKVQQQALTIYEPIQTLEWEGRFISPAGIAYFSLDGQAPDWTTVSTSAVDRARQKGDRIEEAKALFDLGLANHAIGGLYEQAIDYYKQSLKIVEELGYSAPEDFKGTLLGNLGLAHAQSGLYYIDTFDYLQPYWQFTREKVRYNKADRRLEAQALSNLGNAYYGADLYPQAIEFHQKRLVLSREIKDRQGEGKALGDLGVVYHALGEYNKAIEYQEQRLAISREIKDRRGEGQALSNLGIINHTLGNYSKAFEYQQQYLTVSRELKDYLGEEQALGNLGGAYYFQGNYSKAIEFYEKSLAVAWEHREAQIANRVRGNLGLVYFQMGDEKKALELYNRFFQSASYTDSRRGEAVARNNAAVAKLKAGDIAGATDSLLKGIQRLEALRARLKDNDAYKVSIFETQNAPYINLQKILIAQNKLDAALEIAERGRARAFVELLNKRLQAKPAPPIQPPTIEQIKQIAKNHNATLVEYSIIPETFKIQNQLKNQESTLFIWVVKPTGEVILRQADLKPLWQQQSNSLADTVISSRESIGVRGRGLSAIAKVDGVSQTKRLQQLHELLIKPIADLLPADPNARVIFIPKGELFLVPFPALQEPDGKYLIEKHTILTAPAIQVLDLTQTRSMQLRQQPSGQDVLVVGNPTMPSVPPKIGEQGQQLPSLPGAETEAKAIAQILKTQAIIGNQATKSSIVQKLPKARIVHLATHGLLDDFLGLGVPGAIALAPDPPQPPLNKGETGQISSRSYQGGVNGLLTASEILDLKLNAELIVLSACDTGRGRITGDGVIGLSRSLISAGVPSTIVSLWSVPDAPTASLMMEFYRNTQKNPDKAQALRQAMLATMKQYPDPKDWAAFTLIGEP